MKTPSYVYETRWRRLYSWANFFQQNSNSNEHSRYGHPSRHKEGMEMMNVILSIVSTDTTAYMYWEIRFVIKGSKVISITQYYKKFIIVLKGKKLEFLYSQSMVNLENTHAKNMKRAWKLWTPFYLFDWYQVTVSYVQREIFLKYALRFKNHYWRIPRKIYNQFEREESNGLLTAFFIVSVGKHRWTSAIFGARKCFKSVFRSRVSFCRSFCMHINYAIPKTDI
jgi:hypothetical protein